MAITLRTCASVLMLLVVLTGASFADDNEHHKAKNVTVDILDGCDPTTFNAVLGAGSCLPHTAGSITFTDFLAELGEEKSVGEWRFNPNALNAEHGVNITLHNKGGEFHTFTRVEKFGGGLVPVLNQIGGFGDTAPECLQPPSANNVPLAAGQTAAGPTVRGEHTAKFQCCIHPWMRTTVNAEHDHEGHH